MTASTPAGPARHALAAALAAALGLAGCIEVPALDDTVTESLRDAPYPALLPTNTLMTVGPLPSDQASDIERDLVARRGALDARAARLRQATGLDPATRTRMREGVPTDRPGLDPSSDQPPDA
jgi:hypothetical protein